MLKRFAQVICETTHDIIGHHVIITDESAVIIGSSDPLRLHTVHAPSIVAMKQKRETYTEPEEASKMKGVKPGVTLPVFLAGEVVGSIAIAGDHREVARYGLLVQKQAELFLREQLIQESAGARERALRELVSDIASFAPEQDDSAVLATRVKELGYDMDVHRVCLVMELGPDDPETAEKMEDPIKRFPSALAHRRSSDPSFPNHPVSAREWDIPALSSSRPWENRTWTPVPHPSRKNAGNADPFSATWA